MLCQAIRARKPFVAMLTHDWLGPCVYPQVLIFVTFLGEHLGTVIAIVSWLKMGFAMVAIIRLCLKLMLLTRKYGTDKKELGCDSVNSVTEPFFQLLMISSTALANVFISKIRCSFKFGLLVSDSPGALIEPDDP